MTDLVKLYRDDGPLARALGATLGRVVPVAPELLILAGLVPLLAVAAIGGGDVVAPGGRRRARLAVLTVGASSGRRGADKSRWAEPPLVRATEYAALIWIAALEGADAYPAAFALLAALTFRHYDLVYRLRHLGDDPPRLGQRARGRLGRPPRRRLRAARRRRAARRLLRRRGRARRGVRRRGGGSWRIHRPWPGRAGPGYEDEEDEASDRHGARRRRRASASAPRRPSCRRRCCAVDGDRTILDIALANFRHVGLEQAVIVTGYAHERDRRARAGARAQPRRWRSSWSSTRRRWSGTTPTRCGARASRSPRACCWPTATPCTPHRSRSGCSRPAAPTW